MAEYKALTRSNNNRMVAGVCGGLGEFLDIDPTIIRLIFVFGSIAGVGSAFLVYLVLAIVVPPAEEPAEGN
ncbi:PspC domain-containing protein [Chloroflexota bacterium]